MEGKRGRPVEKNPRSYTIGVRFTKREENELRKASEENEMSMSEVIRTGLMAIGVIHVPGSK